MRRKLLPLKRSIGTIKLSITKMKVEIKKPLYETKDGVVVGIYSRRVDEAIRKKEPLVIKCKGLVRTYKPEWIEKHCLTIKKVFLIPDEPMRLYKVFIPKKKESEEGELKRLSKLGVFE